MRFQTIGWHKERLENLGHSIEKQRNKISNIKKDMGKDIERHLFLDSQIREAIKRGKESFDSDRLLVKRCLKTSVSEGDER